MGSTHRDGRWTPHLIWSRCPSLATCWSKFVDKFENEIAKFTGVKRAVLCVNGTNALHISLKLTGVSSGDDVLTQSLTFIATSNAIRYCNANPVFIDVDRDTLGMSPKSLRDFLENCTYSNNGKLYNSISISSTFHLSH